MKSFFALSMAVVVAIAGSAQTFPEASISNGLIRARLYLPDTATGYYRSTRFDWSGVMPSLEYKGHSFFGQWFPRYAPTINDAIMGPVESFWPLDFDQAPAGGAFTVIGVGVLTRPDSNRYSPFRYYPIRDPGTWRISTTKAAIEFQQTLHGQSYSYVYTKNVSLVKDRPELVITHALHNTGNQPISTEVFDHNFFVTDSTDLAPGIVLKFPFPLSADGMTGPTDLAAIGGDSISLLRPFAPRESVYAVLHGYGDSPRDYDIRLENHLTGAGVHITADRPFSKLVYWGSIHTLCPEPYIHVSVAPGETFTWTLRYEFYTLNKRP
jgi:hypothetical protein